jgi:hypothetical protein
MIEGERARPGKEKARTKEHREKRNHGDDCLPLFFPSLSACLVISSFQTVSFIHLSLSLSFHRPMVRNNAAGGKEGIERKTERKKGESCGFGPHKARTSIFKGD